MEQNSGSKGLYGFSMPDGNTYLGIFDPAQPATLKEVVVFRTHAL